jgi:hypothetical protein
MVGFLSRRRLRSSRTGRPQQDTIGSAPGNHNRSAAVRDPNSHIRRWPAWHVGGRKGLPLREVASIRHA